MKMSAAFEPEIRRGRADAVPTLRRYRILMSPSCATEATSWPARV